MTKDEKKARVVAPSPRQVPLQQRILQAVTNWCLFLGGVSALVVGSLSAVHGEATLAGVAWGAGVLLLLGATIDRFESLKGLGIEATTRKIDDKLAQADEALERIRELAELVGANLVFLHSKIGRWGGPTAAEAYALAQGVKANLEGIGSSEKRIREALDPWVRITCGDVLTGLARDLAKAVHRHLDPLHLQRSGALLPTGAETTESLRLKEQIELAGSFRRHLDMVRAIDLGTLPEAFLHAYDQAPLLEIAEVAELRREAEKFMPLVVHIRDKLSMPNPQHWCAELDRLMERAAQ